MAVPSSRLKRHSDYSVAGPQTSPFAPKASLQLICLIYNALRAGLCPDWDKDRALSS